MPASRASTAARDSGRAAAAGLSATTAARWLCIAMCLLAVTLSYDGTPSTQAPATRAVARSLMPLGRQHQSLGCGGSADSRSGCSNTAPRHPLVGSFGLPGALALHPVFDASETIVDYHPDLEKDVHWQYIFMRQRKRTADYEKWKRKHDRKPQRERRRVCEADIAAATAAASMPQATKRTHVNAAGRVRELTQIHTHHMTEEVVGAMPPKGIAPDDGDNETDSYEEVRRSAGPGCYFRGVQVSLMKGHGLVFCKDCPDPHRAGSHMDTWESRYNPSAFHVDGELVYGVPNDGSGEVLNTVGGTIALFDRGGVAFVDKVKAAQAAGANAVIIADDGQCGADFDCGGWLGSKKDRMMAERDSGDAWEGVYIPSVLVTQPDAARIKALLELRTFTAPDIGTQLYVDE